MWLFDNDFANSYPDLLLRSVTKIVSFAILISLLLVC